MVNTRSGTSTNLMFGTPKRRKSKSSTRSRRNSLSRRTSLPFTRSRQNSLSRRTSLPFSSDTSKIWNTEPRPSSSPDSVWTRFRNYSFAPKPKRRSSSNSARFGSHQRFGYYPPLRDFMGNYTPYTAPSMTANFGKYRFGNRQRLDFGNPTPGKPRFGFSLDEDTTDDTLAGFGCNCGK
jgi:hypothetical protein